MSRPIQQSDVVASWNEIKPAGIYWTVGDLLELIAAGGIPFVQDGVGAVPRSLQGKLREVEVSPKDFDAVGDGVTDDTAAVQKAADTGRPVSIKGANYAISQPIVFTGSRTSASVSTGTTPSLRIENDGKLTALPSFVGDAMVVFTSANPAADLAYDCSVSGDGMIDCAGVAARGVYAKAVARFSHVGVAVMGAVLHPVHVGDPTAATSYEATVRDATLAWPGGSNNNAASIGCYFQNATDSVADNVVVIGYRVGFKNTSGPVFYVNCHPWSVPSRGPMTHGFWFGSQAFALNCYADTPHNKNSDGSPDGAITDVYGFFVDTLASVVMQNSLVFINQAYGSDNVVTGVWINRSTGMFGGIDKMRLTGGATFKYKRFIGQLSQTTLVNVPVSGVSVDASSYDTSNTGDRITAAGDYEMIRRFRADIRQNAGVSDAKYVNLNVGGSGDEVLWNIDIVPGVNTARAVLRLGRNVTSSDAGSGFTVFRMDNTGNISHAMYARGNMIAGETDGALWDKSHFQIGNGRLFRDATGGIRYKVGAPSSATDGAPLGTKVAVPGTATSAGKPGDWAADTSFFYVYTGDGTTHTWRRVAVAAW